jgi:hypothetical protein
MKKYINPSQPAELSIASERFRHGKNYVIVMRDKPARYLAKKLVVPADQSKSQWNVAVRFDDRYVIGWELWPCNPDAEA